MGKSSKNSQGLHTSFSKGLRVVEGVITTLPKFLKNVLHDFFGAEQKIKMKKMPNFEELPTNHCS